MLARRRAPVLLIAVLVAVVSTACGGNDHRRASGEVAAATGAPAAPAGSGAPAPAASGTAPAASGTAPAASGGRASPTSAGDGSGWDRIPDIVDEVRPSVVTVFREGGLGSGVVWDADGIIVTNHHVVEGVTEVEVAFADGERSPGRVLASDPRSDLAVVQTERRGLPAATFAEASPELGSLAIAIGSPLGFEFSVTAGIVSGLHRAVPGAAQSSPALVDLLQTDAPISPGNSGGALVGPDGEIIGINVAYIPPEARAVSIGFAIPSPTVIDVVEALLEDGTVRHAYLGVQLAPLTPEVVEQFGLGRDTGALVIDVAAGGPASEGGVEAGDVIVGVDDEPVESVEALLTQLRQHDPGEVVTLRLVRGDDERDAAVTLGTLPG